MMINRSIAVSATLLAIFGCEQAPRSANVLEVAAVLSDTSHLTITVRNTGREGLCYFEAMFPDENAARGFRIFSAEGEERFGTSTGLFLDSDKVCIDPAQGRSLHIDLTATFDEGPQQGDCVLFEFPYFRRAMADQVAYATGVPLEHGGVVRAVWIVRDGQLQPSHEPTDCGSRSRISQ